MIGCSATGARLTRELGLVFWFAVKRMDHKRIPLTVAKRCLPVLVVSSLVWTIVIIGLLTRLADIRKAKLTPRETYMCIPKHFVTNDNEENLDGNLKPLSLENNGSAYCGNVSNVFTAAAEWELSLQHNDEQHPVYTSYKELLPKPCKPSSETKSTIKLTDPYVDMNEENPKLMWNLKPLLHGKYLHFSSKDGSIKVMRNGYYFVGSQVLIQCNFTSGVKVLYHYVYSNGIKLLLKNSEAANYQMNNVTHITSTTGAVFHLDEGDELHVATSRPNCLKNTDQYSKSSYFYVFEV